MKCLLSLIIYDDDYYNWSSYHRFIYNETQLLEEFTNIQKEFSFFNLINY
jgi:hypothetical protein